MGEGEGEEGDWGPWPGGCRTQLREEEDQQRPKNNKNKLENGEKRKRSLHTFAGQTRHQEPDTRGTQRRGGVEKMGQRASASKDDVVEKKSGQKKGQIRSNTAQNKKKWHDDLLPRRKKLKLKLKLKLKQKQM